MKAGEKSGLWHDVRELKRDRILQEAAQLFYERGYAQTSVEAIAERFNATKPFVYYHYASKIDLLVEVCIRATSDALQAVESIDNESSDPETRLRAFVAAFSEVALRNHQFVAIYYREQATLPDATANEILDMRKSIERRLARLLEDGVASGDFHVTDVRMTARLILSMASFAFAWYRHGTEAELQDVVHKIEENAVKLVAPLAPTRRLARQAGEGAA